VKPKNLTFKSKDSKIIGNLWYVSVYVKCTSEAITDTFHEDCVPCVFVKLISFYKRIVTHVGMSEFIILADWEPENA